MKKTIVCPVAVLALGLAATAATVRPVATRAALVNPGMGWVFYHYDNANWNYGADTPAGDTLDSFPGASVIYFRLPWSDLEPEEGRFRWDVIDSYAQSWIAAGKQLAFRFTCTETGYVFATPEWVKNAGAKGHFSRYGWSAEAKAKSKLEIWEPDYLDPVFLAKLENFLAAAGRKWNGNESVAFIDVGSFGMWGEGHTGSTLKLSQEKTHEVVLAHAKLHRKYFDRTPIVISDDVGDRRYDRGVDPTMKAVREMGVGFRDDSIMVDRRPNQWYHAAWARQFAAVGLPVVVETRHFFVEPGKSKSWYRGGLIESTVAYQASYQGIHWWPDDLLKFNREEVDEVNRRLGYRFELREATWPDEAANGAEIEIGTAWANVGVAAPCAEYVMSWSLLDGKGTVKWTWVDESFDFRSLPPTLEDGERTVRRTSRVRFGWKWRYNGTPESGMERLHDGRKLRHGPNVPTVPEGEYDLAVSVGRRDGTPKIALPLAGESGKTRRYVLGKIRIRRDNAE